MPIERRIFRRRIRKNAGSGWPGAFSDREQLGRTSEQALAVSMAPAAGTELYPGEHSDLVSSRDEPSSAGNTHSTQALKAAPPSPQQQRQRHSAATALGTAMVVSFCLVAMAGPQHLPRALGSQERRRMLDAMDAVQEQAQGEWIDQSLHFHEETISPLPLMERLKRHYAVSGHDHHHPQGENYAPLPRADGRRGLQDSGSGGMLSVESTEALPRLSLQTSRPRIVWQRAIADLSASAQSVPSGAQPNKPTESGGRLGSSRHAAGAIVARSSSCRRRIAVAGGRGCFLTRALEVNFLKERTPRS